MPRLPKEENNPAPSALMTLDEVAGYLRLHRSTVYRLAGEGLIPGFKVGSQWRFAKERIDRWMAGQEAAQTARPEAR